MLSLVLALALQGASAPVKDEVAAAPPPAAEQPATKAEKPPAKPVLTGVDENGVPAWAKRKRHYPVQNCGTTPNIGAETWRGEYDLSSQGHPKLHNAPATCH